MLITCSNQGCYSSDHHKLDEQEMKVICNKCLKPIEVSQYALKSLKSLGQVVKKARADFEATCKSCGAHDAPVIKRFGKNHSKVICKHCGGINDHLTRHFAEAFRGKAGIEVVDATPEEMSAWGFDESPKMKRATVERVSDATRQQDDVSDSETVTTAAEVYLEKSPEKVEYYPYKKAQQNLRTGGGVVTVDPTVGSDNSAVVPTQKVPTPNRAGSRASVHLQNRPKTLPPSEEKARKRAEVMLTADAKVTFQTPPAQGVTTEDIFTTGLSEYAPEGDTD